MHCVREITHAAGMIEMQVGVDDIAHVAGLESQLLQLFVDYVLARESLCAERGT